MESHYYLTNGILEAYLLGLVTEQEKGELEQILATDPDVLAQLNDLEVTMQAHFLDNAIPPPPGTREKIELRLSETELEKWQDTSQTYTKSKSTQSQSAESSFIQVEIDDTHIRVHKNWRTAFIAVFILWKVFLILGVYYYFKANNLEKEIDRLKPVPQQTTPASPSRVK